MMEPLTKDKVLKHPILYREAPNIREADLRMALDGLRQDVRGASLDKGQCALILYDIDTWFPAFKKE